MIKVITQKTDSYIESKEKSNGEFMFFCNEHKIMTVKFLGLTLFKKDHTYLIDKLPKLDENKKRVGY